MKPVVIGIIIVIVLIVIVGIAFAVSTYSAADAEVAAAKAAAEKSAAYKAEISARQAAAPVKSKGGSVSSEPVEKPVEKPKIVKMPSLSDYKFYPGKDSGGNDIGNFPGTPTQIASTCNSKPKCKGFNSNGWVKHTISDPSSFSTWTNDPNLGFYVKP